MSITNRSRTLGTCAVLAISAIALAACSSSSASSAQPAPGGSGTASSEADLAYVKAQIDKYSTVPQFEPPGPPFDAVAAAKGKTIFGISINASTQFSQRIHDGYESAAQLVGAKLVWWPNQGLPNQWAQGMETAINQKADIIDLSSGIDPAQVAPQVKQANQAGIPVTVSDAYDTGTPAPAGIAAVGNVPYTLPARLMADWTIYKTGGNVNALFLTANDNLTSPAAAEAVKEEYASKCGSGCKVTFQDVPTRDWATKITPTVTAALNADPDINYILPIYDSMTPSVIAGIQAVGANDKVKIVTFNGSPPILDLMREGDIVEMDVGENVTQLDWAMMDQIMRVLAGVEPAKDSNVGLYIWTKDNVQNAGVPAQYDTGYGDEYIAGFKKTWGIAQ